MQLRASVRCTGVGQDHRDQILLEKVDSAFGDADVGVDPADVDFLDVVPIQQVEKCGRHTGVRRLVDDVRSGERRERQWKVRAVSCKPMQRDQPTEV